LFEPLGIDVVRPALSWNCEGGIRQTAYQIVAKDDGGKLLWDSGKVAGAAMHARWEAAPVPPCTRVLWAVRLWDETDACGAWSKASFETGLPAGVPWQAKWITGGYRPKRNARYPVDCFKKTFTFTGAKKARLYITACGLYEARLNGQRVGRFVLAPGITDYRRRVQYQSYDVTGLLQGGANTLEVQLADGWYRGSCGAWGLRNQYGTETKLIAQLIMTNEDGSTESVCTDESWQWSNDGPIRLADNKDGERVDARKKPGYAGRARLTSHAVIPSAANNVPVVERERLSAALITTPKGKTVLDFGQNIAGYIQFDTEAQAGRGITLRFGELLDSQGEFTQRNIQLTTKHRTTPLQQIAYICRDGQNAYRTTFAIFGFRYVLVESDVPIRPADFTAIAVYSDFEETGQFECSTALLNQFFQNTLWSAKGNACDLPTDCPTRERHGWSGDAQIFCHTAGYLFDYLPFAKKYLRDLYDWQKKNGCLPQIAPEGGTDFYMKAMNGSVGWADAGIIMPYRLWKQYGDTEILQTHLLGMRRYAAFQQRRCGQWYPTARRTGLSRRDRKYLNNAGQAYGEWAEPDDVHHMTWKDCAVPHPEVATAYTAYIMDLMAEMEGALGNEAEAEACRRFAAGCRRSYQALMRTSAYSLDTDRQARLVRPLAFDMLDEGQAAYAKERLIAALTRYGWRLGTGFLSTPLILDVLTEIDIEAACRLLENERMPGWLFMPKNGATTIWEAWEGTESPNGGIASLNHYSKGAVCRWLFDTLCGIRMDGENTFVICPHPGGQLTHAEAAYLSVYGKIRSAWERKEGITTYTITVPPGCTAKILLPGGARHEQAAGTMTYTEEPA
jgi:alpha-L-rhamnosidase